MNRSRKRDASRVTDHDDLGYTGNDRTPVETFDGIPVPAFGEPPSNAELARAAWFIERKVDRLDREIFGEGAYPGMRTLLLSGRITAFERVTYLLGVLSLFAVAVDQLFFK